MWAELRLGPFLDSLAKIPALDIDNLRQRASKYISMEEFRELKRAEGTENQDKKGNRGTGKKLASRIEVLSKIYDSRGPICSIYPPHYYEGTDLR